MNKDFYILPNEEGYLVKSCDNDSEIALFISRRDAELFIDTLMFSKTNSFLNNYQVKSTIPISPQYFPQSQNIIDPYINNNNNSFPQVFFVQQPIQAQQNFSSNLSPYQFYPIMLQNIPIEGIYNGIYPNYYLSQNNNFKQSCTCEKNNLYNNEYLQKNIKNNDDDIKQNLNNLNNNEEIEKNNKNLNNENKWQFYQNNIKKYNDELFYDNKKNNQDFIQETLKNEKNNNLFINSEPIINKNFQEIKQK